MQYREQEHQQGEIHAPSSPGGHRKGLQSQHTVPGVQPRHPGAGGLLPEGAGHHHLQGGGLEDPEGDMGEGCQAAGHIVWGVL